MAQPPQHEVPDRLLPGQGQDSGRSESSPAAAGADLALSRRLARLMDDLVALPGGRLGVGLDAVIGLIPGVGDIVGSGVSGAIVYDAVRLRVPVPTLARMGWNLIVDAVLGLVPFAGDLLDVAHRANRKNFLLLEREVTEHPVRGEPTWGYLLAAFALVVVPLILGLVLGLLAFWFLVQWAVG